MQACLHPGKSLATLILASHVLSQLNACHWHFAAVPVPSPPFLDKRCKSAPPHPMRHPLPLLYCLITGRGKAEQKKWGNNTHLNFVFESSCLHMVINILFLQL